MVDVGMAQKERIHTLAPLGRVATNLFLLFGRAFVVVERHAEVNQNLRLGSLDFDTTTTNLMGASMDG